MRAIRLFTNKKFLTMLLPSSLFIYCYDPAYIAYLGTKRSLIALVFEFGIYLNYKYYGFNATSHDNCGNILSKLILINRGPSIKLGQNLAQHHHILPNEFVKHMEKFCNENPNTDFKSVQRLIKKELKQDMFDVFDYFEETPVAVGSIAQVHRAKLKSGEFVAVKVQHPQIINQTKGDIFVVNMSCYLGEWAFPNCKLQWINKDFRNNMLKEIDFELEYNNIKKAQRLFAKEKNVIVPKVYKEYSSKRILTMSFEEGKSICDLKFRKENNIKVSEISNLLNHVFNKQIFKYGFVHADPHQGNLFIRKEYKANNTNKYKEKPILKLILLDFGLFVDLDKKFISDYTNLWRGIFIQDYNIIEKACVELGVKEHKVFTSMITGKEFSDVMNKNNTDPDERLRIKKVNQNKVKNWVNNNFIHVLENLEYGREELPLMLKIIDYLRSIDSKIGNPVNTFNIMYEYMYEIIFEEAKSNSFFSRLFLYFEYYKLKFGFWISNFRLKSKVKDVENVDLSYEDKI